MVSTKFFLELISRVIAKIGSVLKPSGSVVAAVPYDRKVDREYYDQVAEGWRNKGAKIGVNVRITQDLDHINPHLIEIGNQCVVGGFILTHGPQDDLKPVVVGSGVYIGWNAIILPGVTIGDDCMIGAGAVVTRNVESGCVVGGNPAKKLRDITFDEKERFRMQMDCDRFIGAVPR